MSISPNSAIQSAWLVWLVSWLAAARWSSPTERRPKSRHETAYRLLIAMGAILLFGLHPHWPSIDVVLWPPGYDAAWALVFIAVSGFVFAWWARIVLGRLWSGTITRKVDHSIITSGPYRLVRHPIYSGIILAALATAAIRGTAPACLGATFIVLGLFIKARVEEAFLRRELGEELYRAYARRVPMLVPMLSHIWCVLASAGGSALK